MSLVWEHYPAGGGELLTALAYADHAHDDGTGIRPSVPHVATKTRQSERTVQRYLAKMRKRAWLLTVRNSDGGRGYATEYRINPLWITNPARLSPFPGVAERVTDEVKKGDTGGMERVTLVSSQSSRTISSKTTTTTHATKQHDAVVVGHQLEVLDFPPVFSGELRDSALQIIESCPEQNRQNVLYEVAAIIERGRLRGSPIGLLQGLARKAREGAFVPSHGISYAAKRRQEREARARADAEAALRKQSDPDKAREAARNALATIRNRMGGKAR